MAHRKLLTELDVERDYGIPRKTLQDRRYRGLPPRFVKLGSRVYYRPEDVDAHIAESIRTSTTDTGEAVVTRS